MPIRSRASSSGTSLLMLLCLPQGSRGEHAHVPAGTVSLETLRYGKTSTIITTNQPVTSWGDVLGDPTVAVVLLW